MPYHHFTIEERYVISHMNLAGFSLREIGRHIGRHHTSVSREEMPSKGRRKKTVEARSLFCHIAVNCLNVTSTGLARIIGMAPSAMYFSKAAYFEKFVWRDYACFFMESALYRFHEPRNSSKLK